ncbi:hypothetical protein HanRHA438_Chr16g0772941 [Helianthus annuus]|nr:hypothetical protein HanRHA438_Chr16g0772941 [Helianthus annuus]
MAKNEAEHEDSVAKNEAESEVSVDLARESLIALSYSLPDTDLPSTDQPKSVHSVTEAVNTDEKEKARSELISISCGESPDTKGSPVSPKETIDSPVSPKDTRGSPVSPNKTNG